MAPRNVCFHLYILTLFCVLKAVAAQPVRSCFPNPKFISSFRGAHPPCSVLLTRCDHPSPRMYHKVRRLLFGNIQWQFGTITDEENFHMVGHSTVRQLAEQVKKGREPGESIEGAGISVEES